MQRLEVPGAVCVPVLVYIELHHSTVIGILVCVFIMNVMYKYVIHWKMTSKGTVVMAAYS